MLEFAQVDSSLQKCNSPVKYKMLAPNSQVVLDPTSGKISVNTDTAYGPIPVTIIAEVNGITLKETFTVEVRDWSYFLTNYVLDIIKWIQQFSIDSVKFTFQIMEWLTRAFFNTFSWLFVLIA